MKENVVALLITKIYILTISTLQQPRHMPGLFYDSLTTEVKIFADCVK